MRTLILDCDPGHDDALAILLAGGSPDVDLRLLTTVAGNQSLERTFRNALGVCSIAGIEVPVVAGADRPLIGDPITAGDFHGASGLDGVELPDTSDVLIPGLAVRKMAEVIAYSRDPVLIVATGPITNVASLLIARPDLHDRIEAIYFMGGTTDRGNWLPLAEFNVLADPEALHIVLHSGVPVHMCGLNVTHQALVTPTVIESMMESSGRLGQFCVDLMTFFTTTYREVFGFDFPPLHDPIALAWAIDPSLVTSVQANVEVELSGSLTRGATVVDLHKRTGRGNNATVALSLDVERFWTLMVTAIGNLDRPVT